MPRAARVTREIAPGIHWLGSCGTTEFKGERYHTQNATYLVTGGDRTLMFDTGAPSDWPFLEPKVAEILGGRPLDYVVPSHTELPHSGNFARLLRAHPGAQAIGDLVDFHLFYPELAGRLVAWPLERPIELGNGSAITLLRARIADLPLTQWAYESKQRVMFVADGFAWMHHLVEVGGEEGETHRASECGVITGELPGPPSVAQAERMTVTALGWARTRQATDVLREVEALLRDHPARFVCPTHGNVVSEPDRFLPILAEAFRNSYATAEK